LAVFVVVKGIVLTIVAFGLMIFVHELGHFLAAKLIGVRVECFSFGFGPKLAAHTWGNTEYCISAVPLGGYVKLAGGDEGEAATGAPDEFVSKTPGQRTLVLVAGPLFSVLFGIPLAMGMFVIGRQTPASRVSYVAVGSPAWDAGVKQGDEIIGLDGHAISSFEELRQARAETASDQPLTLRVRRGSAELALPVTRPTGKPLGVVCTYLNTTIRDVAPGTPAAKAGLKPGDTILAVNGQPLRGWGDFRRRVLPNPERPITLLVKRANATFSLTISPQAKERPDPGFTVRLPTTVGFVRKGFPAHGKLREGDTILAVNGRPAAGWWDIEDAVWAGPRTVALDVQRGSEKLALRITRGEGSALADSLGIAPEPFYVVASVHAPTEPPLKAGDIIVKAGRQDLAELIPAQALYTPLDDVLTFLAKAGEITVRRGASEIAVAIKPGTRQVGQLGVTPTAAEVLQKESLLGSIVPALRRTANIGTFAFKIIAKLFQRDVPLSDLMGPVGIAQVTYLSATRGWSDLFWLIHLITVNIGVFNLLPIPPLDGGRIVMLGYEKVRGKRPSRKLQEAILMAGLALVLVIFLVATFNDFRRLLF